MLSVALSVGSRPPGVTWRSVLWSPDFPLALLAPAIAWLTLHHLIPFRLLRLEPDGIHNFDRAQ